MRIYVAGVGLAGPGLTGWRASQPVLAGSAPYVHAATVVATPALLPAAEGRRSGRPVKLALGVAHEAFTHAAHDAGATPTVFTSSSGDGDNVHAILEILASANREVSPTRFHNSVHNAAAGYWSIAARSHAPSTSLCGYDASFAAGLIEVAAQIEVDKNPVALIAYDQPYPEPLHAKRPLADCFAAAFIFTRERDEKTLAALQIEIVRTHTTQATALTDPDLERIRAGIPAARCLPLLAAIARGGRESIVLDYVGGALLDLRVDACA
ncbi:MAG: beta-ketoacyl synthase chain length factor [Pseudomonadota bacterium]